MKKTNLLWVMIAASTLFFSSCGPKTKSVTIDNTKTLLVEAGMGIRPVPNGEPGQNEVYALNFNIMYDVEVAMNGVDFGIIEGGNKSEAKKVDDANNLKVEKFNILKNEEGKSLYVLEDGKKVYLDFNGPLLKGKKDAEKCELDFALMESKFKKTETAGALLNESWNWDVSYGENGNKIWNKQKEEEKKKKKK